LAAAAAAVAAHGTRVVHHVADVGDAAQVAVLVEAAASDLGGLDLLVVNAGGPPVGRFADVDDAAWRTAFELTLMSAVRLIRAAPAAAYVTGQTVAVDGGVIRATL